MNAILSTDNVSKYYTVENSTITAVDQVSFSLHAGEFVALVGPSGSGKTSLLAMLAGLLHPTSGNILIDGVELSQLSQKALTRFRRERIGFTFQANNLVPFLTALENVVLMLQLNRQLSRAGEARACELLARLGLGDRLRSLPTQLSGGQQQRVSIARALIHDPHLVLADEPTASLDTERAYQVVQTLADLVHEEGKAAVMVTHDLRVCRFADRVIQMIDGQLADVLTDPAEIEALANGHHLHHAAGPQANLPAGKVGVGQLVSDQGTIRPDPSAPSP